MNIARLLFVVAIISIWQLLSNVRYLNPIIFADPYSIGRDLLLIFSGQSPIPSFYSHFSATIISLCLGYAIVVCVGVPLGIGFGLIKTFGAVMEPLVIAFFSIPSIILYPIIYLIFGLGINSKVLFGALVGFFIVISNASAAAKNVRREFLVLGNSLGFTKFQTLRKIILPSSLPYIITGLRFGFSLTFIGVVAGEMIASTSGIGSLIEDVIGLLRTTDYFTLIVIVLIIATSGNALLGYFERRINRYRVL